MILEEKHSDTYKTTVIGPRRPCQSVHGACIIRTNVSRVYHGHAFFQGQPWWYKSRVWHSRHLKSIEITRLWDVILGVCILQLSPDGKEEEFQTQTSQFSQAAKLESPSLDRNWSALILTRDSCASFPGMAGTPHGRWN